MLCLVAQFCLTLCDSMDYSPLGSSVHGDSPGKNTGVGCHFLLQGIFATQELWSPALQADSLPTRLQGKPIIDYIPYVYFISLWLIYFVIESLFLLTPLPVLSIPFGQPQIYSLYLWISSVLFCFSDFTYKWNHMIFVFLCLTYFI